MSNTLFGIKACDTMKKARTWPIEHGVNFAAFMITKPAVSTAATWKSGATSMAGRSS